MNKYVRKETKLLFVIKKVVPAFIILILHVACYAQHPQNQITWDSLTAIENDPFLSASQKLQHLYNWKKNSETFKLHQDSVYAGILHRIGVYEFLANKNYDTAIIYTLNALQINTSGKKGYSKLLLTKSYYNLGYYYEKITLFNKAVTYYDSAITLAQSFHDTSNLILDARLTKAYIFFRIGDYQKSIEESIMGIGSSVKKKDSLFYLKFLNQRAQSLFFQNELQQSLSDVETAIDFANRLHQPYQLASAYKMKGYIYAKKSDFSIAEASFRKSIQERLQTKDYGQVAGDYNDFGNFYRDSLQHYTNAKKCYIKAIEYAQRDQDLIRLSRVHVNFGKTYFYEHNYKEAIRYYLKAMQYFKLNSGNDFLTDPISEKLTLIGNKEIILVLLESKTELLLNLYKENNNKKYLSACLHTALLTDTLITKIRHEQTGYQSKLYWRHRTRDFFANSIEACYLANNTSLTFFFMEKSRAVLLNDQLNELGASAHLPVSESEREANFQINIIVQQQKLASLSDTSKEYADQQLKLLNAKDDFEHYIKSIEDKYPVYYQYKYADSVPALTDLQKYLAVSQASFVHYFMNDTVTYMLSITPHATKMIKLSKNEFNPAELVTFMQFCSDKQKLNNNFALFASLSNALYKALFQPLQIQKGRVIICADNFLLPFEALCIDAGGNQFLIYNHVFSYVYSARYLLKDFNSYPAKGNFIGFAPVFFQSSLSVPDLKQSADALKRSADNYDGVQLFTNSEATRNNFIHQIAGYTIVNVFSHARADTSDNEPVLFMHDSIIKLSELQLLNKPATKLVVLSACQTNVGKNATGEGIYSLARGFTSAGIPSIAATLWKADDLTIYTVSEKFHEYLSHGMRKDDALQKAKLFFMQSGGKEKLLPYYWANMIVIGNAEPVVLSNNSNVWLWIAPGVLLSIALFVIVLRRRHSAS